MSFKLDPWHYVYGVCRVLVETLVFFFVLLNVQAWLMVLLTNLTIS